jgi:hypothetical protein
MVVFHFELEQHFPFGSIFSLEATSPDDMDTGFL